MLRKFKKIALFVFLSLICMPKSLTESTSYSSSISSLKDAKESNKVLIPLKPLETEQTPARLGLLSLKETLKDVDILIQSIIGNFSSYVPRITSDLGELLTKITSRISNALEEIGSGLLDAGDLLLRDAIQNMQSQLFLVKDEFQSLALLADKEFHLVVDHFNNTLINHTESIDLWAANLKQELRSFNNTQLYKKGCQVVDKFMQQTSDDLRKCCNIAVKPVHSLCRSVREVLAEAFSVLADVIEQMQTCLEDKNSYLEYMLPCINVAYDNIYSLIARSAQLRHNITTMMPMKIVFSKFCILIVSVQMEQGQHRVEHTIASKMDT